MKKTYTLMFSVQHLTELLENAGFDISPGPDIRGGFIQFVSTPQDNEVFVEWARGLLAPWERLTGGRERKKQRDVEKAATGQYL